MYGNVGWWGLPPDLYTPEGDVVPMGAAARLSCAQLAAQVKYWRTVRNRSGILTKRRRDAQKKVDHYLALYRACLKRTRMQTKQSKQQSKQAAKAEKQAAKQNKTASGFESSAGSEFSPSASDVVTSADSVAPPDLLPEEGTPTWMYAAGAAAALGLLYMFTRGGKKGGGSAAAPAPSKPPPRRVVFSGKHAAKA